MPHQYEAQVIKELEDNYTSDVVNQFRNCIQHAQYWKRYRHLPDGTEDTFSNVMNRSGCDANLTQWLSHNPNLLQRAQTCLNYYENNS